MNISATFDFWFNTTLLVILVLTTNAAFAVRIGSIHNTTFVAVHIGQTFYNMSCVQCRCEAMAASAVGGNCAISNGTCQLISNYSAADSGLKDSTNKTFFFEQLPPELSTTATSTFTTMIVLPTTQTTTTKPTTWFGSSRYHRWNKTGVLAAGDGSEGNTSSQLKEPRCVFIDANDTVYVCDTGNHRIQKWPVGASSGITVAGTNSAGATGNQLNSPRGLTIDRYGYMYVADTDNDRVQRLAPASKMGVTVAGFSGTGGGNGNNELSKPISVLVDENDTLYIADSHNQRVMRYAPNAKTGTFAFGNMAFNKPFGIAFPSGVFNQIYLTEDSATRVGLWAMGASSAIVNVNISSLGGKPAGIAVDWHGHVYVTDSSQGLVNCFHANISNAQTVVGSSANSTPTLTEPTGIAFDSKMNLYVTSKRPNSGVYKYEHL